MCGRYFFTRRAELAMRRLAGEGQAMEELAVTREQPDLPREGGGMAFPGRLPSKGCPPDALDVHPADRAWVVCNPAAEGGHAGTGREAAESRRENAGHGLGVAAMRWGFPGRNGQLIFNARSETAAEKPLFRDSLALRRCVIPAGGFYEWNVRKEKVRFTGEDGQPLFLAGFYRRFEKENRFVVLTVPANASMAPVHDRMPLVLAPEEAEAWILDGSQTARLLCQVPAPLEASQEYEQLELPFL